MHPRKQFEQPELDLPEPVFVKPEKLESIAPSASLINHIQISPFGNSAKQMGKNNNVANTYSEVLDLLKKIKKTRHKENYEVFHVSNENYPEHSLLRNNPHCDSVEELIQFVKNRQELELANKHTQVDLQLFNLKYAINRLKHLVKDTVVTKALEGFYTALENEIFSDTVYSENELNQPHLNGPDLSKTYYPTLISHFTDLTESFIGHPEFITEAEVAKSKKELDVKLHGKPMSTFLRSAITGVFNALIGFALGAAVGAGISWWLGGVAAIPCAIIGGATCAIVGGINGGAVGFFQGRDKHKRYQTREENPENFKILSEDKNIEDIAKDTLDQIAESAKPSPKM